MGLKQMEGCPETSLGGSGDKLFLAEDAGRRSTGRRSRLAERRSTALTSIIHPHVSFTHDVWKYFYR